MVCALFVLSLVEVLLSEPVRTKVIYVVRSGADVAVSLYYHMHRHKDYNFAGTDWCEFFNLFLQGQTEAGSWSKHVLQWLSCAAQQQHNHDSRQKNGQHEKQVLVVSYPNLHRDPHAQVARIAHFLGVQLTPEWQADVVRATSFESMVARECRPEQHPRRRAQRQEWGQKHLEDLASMAKSMMVEPVTAPGNAPAPTERTPHFRHGVNGDWQLFFSPQHRELFDQLHFAPLRESGLLRILDDSDGSTGEDLCTWGPTLPPAAP